MRTKVIYDTWNFIDRTEANKAVCLLSVRLRKRIIKQGKLMMRMKRYDRSEREKNRKERITEMAGSALSLSRIVPTSYGKVVRLYEKVWSYGKPRGLTFDFSPIKSRLWYTRFIALALPSSRKWKKLRITITDPISFRLRLMLSSSFYPPCSVRTRKPPWTVFITGTKECWCCWAIFYSH